MDIIIAIGHLVGALVGSVVVSLGTTLFGTWVDQRTQKRAMEELSVALGVPVDDLGSDAVAPRLLQLSSERYSTELLRNRVSDLCGALRTGWIWFGTVAEVAFWCGVAWYTFTDNLNNAVFAWFVIGIVFFFWLVSLAFSLLCKFLTGRYPGQASAARKAMAATIRASAARKLMATVSRTDGDATFSSTESSDD